MHPNTCRMGFCAEAKKKKIGCTAQLNSDCMKTWTSLLSVSANHEIFCVFDKFWVWKKMQKVSSSSIGLTIVENGGGNNSC